MEPQIKERLVAYYAAYLSKLSQDYFESYHYDKVHFVDDARSDYRSVEDIERIYLEARNEAKKISEELIDEVDAQGVDAIEDKEKLSQILDSIIGKLYQRLDKIVSDLS